MSDAAQSGIRSIDFVGPHLTLCRASRVLSPTAPLAPRSAPYAAHCAPCSSVAASQAVTAAAAERQNKSRRRVRQKVESTKRDSTILNLRPRCQPRGQPPEEIEKIQSPSIL